MLSKGHTPQCTLHNITPLFMVFDNFNRLHCSSSSRENGMDNYCEETDEETDLQLRHFVEKESIEYTVLNIL